MSINDFINKIKGQISIDRSTFVCLFVLVLVGLSSFGLGRLSVYNPPETSGIEIVSLDQNSTEKKGDNDFNNYKEKRMYVASKNGKMYYTKDCSGAKRIKEGNQVWFASSIEAEKAGYEFSLSCNN